LIQCEAPTHRDEIAMNGGPALLMCRGIPQKRYLSADGGSIGLPKYVAATDRASEGKPDEQPAS